MNEAEKMLRSKNREEKKKLVDIVTEEKEDNFKSNMKGLLDDDAEMEEDAFAMFEDEEQRGSERTEDTQNEEKADTAEKAQRGDKVGRTQAEGNRREEIDDFMDEIEGDSVRASKQKNRKSIRKLNNDDKEKADEEKAKDILSKLFSQQKMKKNRDNIVKMVAERMRRRKQVTKGLMDMDGNRIPRFDVNDNDFRLFEYRDSLDTLAMETEEEVFEHYKKLMDEQKDTEWQREMNRSMRKEIEIKLDVKNNSDMSGDSVFSTMSGMQSMEYFNKDDQDEVSDAKERSRTEKMGNLSGEMDFINYLGEIHQNETRRKNLERLEHGQHGKDRDEDVEDNSSESSTSGSEGSEREQIKKKITRIVQHSEDDLQKMEKDSDEDQVEELNMPAEKDIMSDKQVEEELEKEKEEVRRHSREKKVRIPKVKKIKDGDADGDAEEESSGGVPDWFLSPKDSSQTTDSGKSSQSVSEIDEKKIEQGEKDTDEDAGSKQADRSAKSHDSEHSRQTHASGHSEDKSGEHSKKSKSEEHSRSEESQSSLGDEPANEYKPREDDTKDQENEQNGVSSIDERFKNMKREEREEAHKKEVEAKAKSVDINNDENTNPMQGQPREDAFDVLDKDPKKGDDQDKAEEDEEEEHEDWESSHKKKKGNSNDKFGQIEYEYIVPEMQVLTIENYHENSTAKRIEDYTETDIVEQISLSARRLSEDRNHNKHHELGRIYRLYKLLPFCLQRAIESCQPNMQSVKKVCDDFHKKACVENNYVVRLSCIQSESYFNGACYKNCPEDMKDAKVACIKDKAKKRRVELLEDPVGKDLDEKYAERYLVTKCSEFGPSYVSLGPDLCIQECPYGWKDLGKICLKPVRFKNQKAFFYDSSMD